MASFGQSVQLFYRYFLPGNLPVAKKLFQFFNLIAGAFERGDQYFAVDLCHYFLHDFGIDEKDILEHKHEMPDGIDE